MSYSTTASLSIGSNATLAASSIDILTATAAPEIDSTHEINCTVDRLYTVHNNFKYICEFCDV